MARRPGNLAVLAYDAADRLTTLTTPLGTTTSVYDSAGQLTDQTDAYDSGGRRTGETWVGASPSEAITYTYDADGELTGAKDANATLTFTYDSGGRQTSAATSSAAGQPNVTLTSGYNQLNQRSSLTDNLASVGRTTFVYDNAQRLTTITNSLGGSAGPQVVFGYDAANRPTSESRTIGGSGTAVATSFSYDAANRLTTLTHQVAGGSGLATYVYGYDNANRLTSEQNAEGTVTYGYDNTNQLTGASGSRAETYAYDSGGNRTMAGYTTGAGNELTAAPGATYVYDNAGNLSAQTNTSTHVTTSYTYDYHNRLTGVTVGGTAVATYTYDALGRRTGTDVNGAQSWTVWDGPNPYATFNGSGALQTRYLHGPAIDALLARTDSGGTTAWYLTDRLGTVRDLVNTTGTVLDHLSYDSYGKVLSESSPSNGDPFKFAGMQYNATTGLYFDNARYYDPATGRFVNQDPTGFAAGDPNLYRYVGNGPTNAIDPSGEAGVPIGLLPPVFVGPGGINTNGQPIYPAPPPDPHPGRHIYIPGPFLPSPLVVPKQRGEMPEILKDVDVTEGYDLGDTLLLGSHFTYDKESKRLFWNPYFIGSKGGINASISGDNAKFNDDPSVTLFPLEPLKSVPGEQAPKSQPPIFSGFGRGKPSGVPPKLILRDSLPPVFPLQFGTPLGPSGGSSGRR